MRNRTSANPLALLDSNRREPKAVLPGVPIGTHDDFDALSAPNIAQTDEAEQQLCEIALLNGLPRGTVRWHLGTCLSQETEYPCWSLRAAACCEDASGTEFCVCCAGRYHLKRQQAQCSRRRAPPLVNEACQTHHIASWCYNRSDSLRDGLSRRLSQ